MSSPYNVSAMPAKYILAIDQGTTSSRALLFDQEGKIKCSSQKELENIYPKPGWCDHDPNVIWETVHGCMKDVVDKVGKDATIVGIGLANQRETTVAWSTLNECVFNLNVIAYIVSVFRFRSNLVNFDLCATCR